MTESIRVTFDTNVLDRAVRPQRFPKDPRQNVYHKVQQALKLKHIEGYFSETLATLEGIQNIDRADVFGSTNLRHSLSQYIHSDTAIHTTQINLVAEQTKRKPLHPETVARIQAALAVGMRTLGAPRVGFVRINDPNHTIYAPDGNESDLSARLERYHTALNAIEARGLGFSHVQALAHSFAQRDGVVEPFFYSLRRAKDIHEKRAVQRAIREWSDADSVAAHIGYEIDFFCTEDEGKSAGMTSVFDAENRAWLQTTYGVCFVTLSELAARI